MGNPKVTSGVIKLKDQGGGVWGSAPEQPAGDWQLPVGHFEPSTTAAELIHPRPDSETSVWAKHRRHYPGIPYAIPIGVSFGSWPFFFEPITLPAGAVIGQQLSVSGDKLVAGPDYGVVSWDNPTVGNHSFHIKVYNQDGTAPVDVQWTLEVTTAGTIFVDASAIDDSGTGAIGDPFKTLDGWYKASTTDRTFSGYQVHYAVGTYDVTTADVSTTGNLQMNWFNKPLVHYSSAGAIWNYPNSMTVDQSAPAQPPGEVHLSDWFMGGITCIGGKAGDNPRRMNVNSGASGPFPYDGTGGGCRNTWFRSPQKDWITNAVTTNNAGVCVGANTRDVNKTRSHWYVSQCDISNIKGTDGNNVNFNGWYIGNCSNFLVENLSISDTQFGRGAFSAKSSEYKSCYRNLDASQAPDQAFIYENAGSYAPLIGGGIEFSYNKVIYAATQTNATAVVSGHGGEPYISSEPYHEPDIHFRNNVSKAPATAGRTFRAFAAWPVTIEKDIWVSEGDGTYIDGPTNTQQDGEWLLYGVAGNPLDSNLNLTGTDRGNYLGIRGAEVAG